jgi:hypothetical protein
MPMRGALASIDWSRRREIFVGRPVGRVQCLVGPRPNHSIHATGPGKQSDYTALLARSSGCLADARFHLDRGMHYYPFGEELPDLKLLLNHITDALSGTSGARQLAPTALLHCSTTHARSPPAGLCLASDSTKRMMTALASLMGRDHCVFPNSRRSPHSRAPFISRPRPREAGNAITL